MVYFKDIRNSISAKYYNIVTTNDITIWDGADRSEIPHRFDDREVVAIECDKYLMKIKVVTI